MINQCKNFNIALGICTEIKQACLYMADPTSCHRYDEEGIRPYHTPSAQENNPEAESLTEFTDRIEAELNGMGIKVDREEIEEAPDWF